MNLDEYEMLISDEKLREILNNEKAKLMGSKIELAKYLNVSPYSLYVFMQGGTVGTNFYKELEKGLNLMILKRKKNPSILEPWMIRNVMELGNTTVDHIVKKHGQQKVIEAFEEFGLKVSIDEKGIASRL